MNEKSQREAIAKYLRTGKSLTPLEALDRFGCLRLGARIWELRQQGMTILKYMTEVGRGEKAKRVAAYYQIRSGRAA